MARDYHHGLAVACTVVVEVARAVSPTLRVWSLVRQFLEGKEGVGRKGGLSSGTSCCAVLLCAVWGSAHQRGAAQHRRYSYAGGAELRFSRQAQGLTTIAAIQRRWQYSDDSSTAENNFGSGTCLVARLDDSMQCREFKRTEHVCNRLWKRGARAWRFSHGWYNQQSEITTPWTCAPPYACAGELHRVTPLHFRVFRGLWLVCGRSGF